MMKGEIVFKRSILIQFEKWKAGSHRKPLILRGARQVGKTSAVRLFAGDLPGYMELNLEAPGEKSVFERNLPVRDLISAIRLSRYKLVLQRSTIFDCYMKRSLSCR